MDETLRKLVRERANNVCEYCLFPEKYSFSPFQVDHVIAQKHGGPTVESNLAWSCYACNTFKGPCISGWISDENDVVRLFHPRKDQWSEHFRWNGPILVANTRVGIATINVLRINHHDAVTVRRALRDLGYQP